MGPTSVGGSAAPLRGRILHHFLLIYSMFQCLGSKKKAQLRGKVYMEKEVT